MKLNSLIALLMVFGISITNAQEVPKLELKSEVGFFKVPVNANLMTPTGVAANSQNHIFIVNAGANKLMEFDQEGNFVSALADGILVAPHGVRVDKDDNIWVTDLELHVVLKLSPKGHLLMVLGQKGNSGEYDKERQMALFFKPADIAFGQNGDIYVADGYGNSRVVKLNKHGEFVKAWGKKGAEEGEFDNPHNIVVDNSGLVYVADRYNKRIQIFDADGNFKKSWTHLGNPWGLALTKDQELYITDGLNEKVLKLDLEGNILGEFGQPGSKYGQFKAAHGITVDAVQNLYVTGVLNWRVQKLTRTDK